VQNLKSTGVAISFVFYQEWAFIVMLLFLFYKLRQLQVSESVQFSFFIQNVQKRISFVCTICKYEKTSNGHIHNSQIPTQLQH